jgi:2-amino-4-hydroxy-6-hydroxymethyldihydropteridine diphosphokinase
MSGTAYISIGSNLGDRERNLREAIESIRRLGNLKAVSSLYETEPVEFTDQPWFLNCVIEIDTAKKPRELLGALLAIEREMGRERLLPKGPRLIDLDIVLFDELVFDGPQLQIPHPAMHLRRFVLEPLVEIAPAARHPRLDKTARELLASLPASAEVRRVG